MLDVPEPGRMPKVSATTAGEDDGFSTKITIELGSQEAVEACLSHARQRLEYYPCPVTIDGTPHESIWQRALRDGHPSFARGAIRGFLEQAHSVRVLCKYQHVMSLSLPALLTGARDQTYDLRDYASVDAPFVPNMGGVIECGDLHLTISRDSFYCDDAFRRMLTALKDALMRRLAEVLRDPRTDPFDRSQIVLANHYTLSSALAHHIGATLRGGPRLEHSDVYEELVQAKVYRVNGRAETYSLADLVRLRTAELPLFFSPGQSNLRWLGGAFKHDFVVLPPECAAGSGAPNLYDTVFRAVFGDVVNLDSIRKDRDRITELVARGIVHRDALGAQAELVRELELDEGERALLTEINELLASKLVLDAVQQNLALRIRRVSAAYFKLENQSVAVSAGLFDGAGKVVDRLPKVRFARDCVLGLRLDHALVQELAASSDPHRAYYALTFLSHELARCQELLVPDTPAFYFVKNALAARMRRGLVRQLLSARSGANRQTSAGSAR